jgi:hypothetical protein
VTNERLRRRVSSLEQNAVDVQRREIRDLVMSLPEARDLTPAELDEAITLVTAALEARLTPREFAERLAARMGLDTKELLATFERDARFGC